MTRPMTAAAADWVYAEVLTPAYRRAVSAEGRGQDEDQLGTAAVRICPCQWGPCGRCEVLGRHDQCTTKVGFAGQPPVSSYGWLHNASGLMVFLWSQALGRRVSVEVWPSGTPCAWRCPCVCPVPEPVLVREPEFEQLGLFALAGGAR